MSAATEADGRWAVAVAALALAAMPVAARADVYEVGGGGALSVRAGAGAVSWDAAVEDDRATVAMPTLPADAMTAIDPPSVPTDYAATTAAAAAAARISPALLAALVRQESGWRVRAISSKGAVGLTQLMPGTARDLAVDPRDAAANLGAGARYLRALLDRFGGDVERALAAYNAGPGRVARSGGLPQITETRRYVAAIIDRLGEIVTMRPGVPR